MERCDALIAGGGPAGSTCALFLQRAGWRVIVLDRATFPRDKVCAGWLTPQVFPLLDLSPDEYRSTGHTFQEIGGFRTGLVGGRPLDTQYGAVVSYAIRRCEFDDFLLRRARVRVLDGTPLTTLERRAGRWIVNGGIDTPLVIGAGGHFCPVARHLQGRPDRARPVVAKELEFRLDGDSTVLPGIPEIFFSSDLEGYGWCFRKGDYLNVGLGRRDSAGFAAHLRDFSSFLTRTGRTPDVSRGSWRGHAYHARGTGVRPLVGDGMVLVGDAAGLAYPESGEGIKPAIESGRLAAETLVAAQGRCDREELRPYESAIRALYPPHTPTRPLLQPAVRAVGRVLLNHSPAFTRHVLLDRWFLRIHNAGMSSGRSTKA